MPILLSQLSYTALSVQVASNSTKSLCGIALLVINNGAVIFKKTFLINPPTKTFSFASYHGITAEKVKDSPKLNDIWADILPYLKDKNVVVYMLDDIQRRLQSSLNVYGISMPDCNFLDVRDLFNQNREKFSFRAIAKSIGFDDNFKNGNMMDNLLLYQAIIENAAQRGSSVLQKSFHVKSETTPKLSSATKANKKSSPILNDETHVTPSKKDHVHKAQSSGCLIPILFTLLVLCLFVTLTA